MALKHEGTTCREVLFQASTPGAYGDRSPGSMQWFVNLGPALWSQDEKNHSVVALAPYAAYRRSELQAMYAKFGRRSKANQRVGVESKLANVPEHGC